MLVLGLGLGLLSCINWLGVPPFGLARYLAFGMK